MGQSFPQGSFNTRIHQQEDVENQLKCWGKPVERLWITRRGDLSPVEPTILGKSILMILEP